MGDKDDRDRSWRKEVYIVNRTTANDVKLRNREQFWRQVDMYMESLCGLPCMVLIENSEDLVGVLSSCTAVLCFTSWSSDVSDIIAMAMARFFDDFRRPLEWIIDGLDGSE